MALKEAMADKRQKGRERNNVYNKNFTFNGHVNIQREDGVSFYIVYTAA
jgi:hypothetical protein